MQLHNALTVDVEDWYHVCGIPESAAPPRPERRVRQATELVLELLSSFGVKGTFFVLGSVAEENPELVPMIARRGHEIASHGWSHRLVTTLSKPEFREEVRRTQALLEQQGGRKPVGFRAPQWSLSLTEIPWAFDILREEGYLYDSSLNPLRFVGDPAGKRHPFTIETSSGKILEFPPLVLPSPFGNMPVGGGWGFRFFPFALVSRAVQHTNRNGAPAVLYVHPREVDHESPRLQLPPLKRFATYGPGSDAVARLQQLLERFSFTTLEHMAEQWHSA